MKDKVLTYEEKLQMADRMRNSSRYKPVEPEEFKAYSASEEAMHVSTSSGVYRVFMITPENVKDSAALIINLHGGGFINKRLDRDKLFCYKLAHRLKCKVMDVDYKLAPEQVFPVALNECFDILEWVYLHAHELGINQNQIRLMGHSAGGNLAVGITIKALEHKMNIVERVAIEYAPLDLFTDPAEKPRFERDMPPERARAYNSFYCRAEELRDYRVSPLFTENTKLTGFPKVLNIISGDDMLSEEGIKFSQKLLSSGVDVESMVFKGCVHGFTVNRMDRHEEALDMIVSFLE